MVKAHIARRRVTALLAVVALITVCVLVAINLCEQFAARASRVAVGPEQLTFDIGPAPSDRELPSVARELDDEGVWGVVRDVRGNCVADAMVALIEPDEVKAAYTASERVVRTAADGRYSFSSSVVDPRFEIHARHNEYQPAIARVADAVDRRVDIVMRDGLDIHGRVLAVGSDEGVGSVHIVGRGVGAPASFGRLDGVWNGRISGQVATTEDDGTFVLAGLPPGRYHVELAEQGVITVPDTRYMRRSPVGPSRGTTVEAGSAQDVILRLLPASVAWFRVQAGSTGAIVADALVTPLMRPDRVMKGPVLTSTSGGESWDYRDFAARQGEHAILVKSQRWPVAEEMITVEIRADGYNASIAAIPLRPVGDVLDHGPTIVTLEPTATLGVVACELVGESGHVPECAIYTQAVNLADGRTMWVRLGFDVDGKSLPVALPVGPYRIQSDPRDAHGRVHAEEFQVSASCRAQVQLRLATPGLRFDVRDESGCPLDDVGVLAGPGSGPVTAKWLWRTEERGLEQTGMFLVPPGAGQPRSLTYLVADDGMWTIEFYRHGYSPERAELNLVDGHVHELRIVMRLSPSGAWDTWSQEPLPNLQEYLKQAKRAK